MIISLSLTVAFIGYSLVAKDCGIQLKILMSYSNNHVTMKFSEKQFFFLWFHCRNALDFGCCPKIESCPGFDWES